MLKSHIMNGSALQVRSISRCLNAFVYCSDCVIKSIEIRGILFSSLLLLASWLFRVILYLFGRLLLRLRTPSRALFPKISTLFSRDPFLRPGLFAWIKFVLHFPGWGSNHTSFRTFSDQAMSYLTLLLTSFPFKLSLLGGAGYLGYILPSPPPLLSSPSPSTKQQESTQESYTSNAHSYTQPTSHQDHETYSHHKTQKS